VGRVTLEVIELTGDLTLFAVDMIGWLCLRRLRRGVLFPNLYQIGVLSIPVVIITGGFIGMVLAVQTYDQLHDMHLETTIGSVVNIALLQELGPVLAATMLAGRVGSAMAAELGTMRVTEQIEALRVLGANPIHYLVVPRFLACFLLIPLLTVVADTAGILGGWFFSSQFLGINSQHYWHHADKLVSLYDFFHGVFKSTFFGAAIAIISCHRGFHCDAGAEGVGKAATEAFVFSFVSILALDLSLGLIYTGFENAMLARQAL
jgi:phospholipid/cholesterol/gamma-HCH transport system permease protein